MKRKEPKLVSKLGVVKRYSIQLPDLPVTGIIEIEDDEFLISTSVNLIRQDFTGNVIGKFSHRFSLMLYSRELDIIFGVFNKADGGSRLTILSPDEMTRPLLANFDLQMNEVKRLEFLSKSHTLITVGDGGYRGWRFENGILRIVFQVFEAVTQFIGVDSDRDLFFVKLGDKFKSFNGYGENEIMEEIHAIPEEHAFEVVGEHVVFVKDQIELYHRQLKTSVSFSDFSERPWACFSSRRGVLSLIFEKHAIVYDIRLPWKLWLKQTESVKKFVKTTSNSYVITENFDKSVHFLSMRDKSELFSFPDNRKRVTRANTNLTPSPRIQKGKLNTTLPRLTTGKSQFEDDDSVFSFFYDEGFLMIPTLIKSKSALEMKKLTTNGRERILQVNNSGVLSVLGMKTTPFLEIKRKNIRGTHVTICIFEGKWAYAAMSSRKSELLILDSRNFLILDAYEIKSRQVQALYYYYPCNSVVIQTLNEVILFDPRQGGIVSRGLASYSEASALFGDYLYIGLNGVIEKVIVANKKVRSDVKLDTRVQSQIVDFAFSKTNWICGFENGSVIIWDYFDEPLVMLAFPFQLYSIRYLGRENDILLATDSAIMVLEGTRSNDQKKVTMPRSKHSSRSPRFANRMDMTIAPQMSESEPVKQPILAQTQPIPRLTARELLHTLDEMMPSAYVERPRRFEFDLPLQEEQWSSSPQLSEEDTFEEEEASSQASAITFHSVLQEEPQPSMTKTVSFTMPVLVGADGMVEDRLDTTRPNLRITRKMAAFGDDAESDSDNCESLLDLPLRNRTRPTSARIRYGYSAIPTDLFTTFGAKPASPPQRSTAAIRRDQDHDALFIKNFFSPK